MEDQLIDSLKEWFEKEWLFERHLTSEFMKDKGAFVRGCEYFDKQQYSFKGELLVQLRKESGLAEVARSNRDLEKYATYCFRQVEKVLSEFILVNPGSELIAKYLLNNKDFIIDPTPIIGLNSSVISNLSHIRDNNFDQSELNPYCLILKINNIQLKYGKCRYVNNSTIKLSQKEENRIFKSLMYFKTFGFDKELTENVSKIEKEFKPSLHAFEHMYFFRNINSHLNSKSTSFTMPKTQDETEKYRIQPFYNNPMDVMNIDLESPGFYQRYVDMVLFLYSEYLRNPEI